MPKIMDKEKKMGGMHNHLTSFKTKVSDDSRFFKEATFLH